MHSMQKGAQNAMGRLFVILVTTWLVVGSQTACGAMSNDAGDYNYNANTYSDAGTTWECYSANDCTPGQYCNEFHRCV